MNFKKINFKQLNLESVKKYIDANITLITTLGTIISGLYVIIEYNNQQQTRREDKALELFMKEIDDPLLESIKKLDIFYNNKEIDKLLKVLQTQGDVAAEYHQYIVNFSHENNAYQDIRVVLNYYEGIAVCVQINLCDAKVINYFSKTGGQEFFRTFYPIFCELRHKLKDDTFGLELEKFYNPHTVEQKFDDKTLSFVSESRTCDYYHPKTSQ